MRRIVVLFVSLCLAWACAQAELTPELSDPQDCVMQRLSIMSQRDEAFEGLLYHGGYLTARGCQPVSVANAVIAAFGVGDRQAAVELIKETAEVLVIERARGKGRMELARMRQLMSAQAQDYPALAAVIEGYAGEIAVLDTQLDAQTAGDYFARRQSGMLVGRMTVHQDWTALLEIVQRLHDMGLDDAMLCLASVSAGTESSGAPLSSGEGGHYVTLVMYVDAFVREGRMYVLDSLPRALAGEESGYTCVLRSPYPFALVKTGFSMEFDARRIRDTVIRLAPREADAWQSAPLEQKAKMLDPLLLYGPGALMITVPQTDS